MGKLSGLMAARLPRGSCFRGTPAPGDNPSPQLSLVPIGLQWNLTVWFVVGTL